MFWVFSSFLEKLVLGVYLALLFISTLYLKKKKKVLEMVLIPHSACSPISSAAHFYSKDTKPSLYGHDDID